MSDGTWSRDKASFTIDFRRNRTGDYRVWEDPQPDAHYILGADIALGHDIGDKKPRSNQSTIAIYRRLPGLLEQVAEGRTRCEPLQFGLIIAAWATRYNNAVINPERNIVDATLAGIRQAGYPTQFWYQPPITMSVVGAMSSKYFFHKGAASSQFLFSVMNDYLARGALIIRSEPLLSELALLQRDKSGRPVTSGKDLAIATMMAVIVDATTDFPLEPHQPDKQRPPMRDPGKDWELTDPPPPRQVDPDDAPTHSDAYSSWSPWSS